MGVDPSLMTCAGTPTPAQGVGFLVTGSFLPPEAHPRPSARSPLGEPLVATQKEKTMTKKPTQPTIDRGQKRDTNGQKDVWGITHTADALAKADSILSHRPAMYLLD